MNKKFKIARRPGQAPTQGEADGNRLTPPTPEEHQRKRQRRGTGEANHPTATKAAPAVGPSTRKTIEVPEDFFYMVKMRALQRHIKEKELWAEILSEYFTNHPAT